MTQLTDSNTKLNKGERRNNGEYSAAATFNMWTGYWLAAKDLGHISGDDKEWSNAHK